MRLLHAYLIGYFALIVGAGLALWQAGVLVRIPLAWLVMSALVCVALSILLAITSTPVSQR